MEIISRIIPAKPRNKELYFLKSTGSYSGGSSSSGSSGGIGSPSYWDLITTDEEGVELAVPYIKTTYPVISEKEITAYGAGASESGVGASSLYELSDVDPSVENAPENSILKKIGTHWKAVSGDLQPLLVSGTNIATINGQNLLNGGNILIEAGSSGSVSSVGLSAPVGLTVTGSPITGSGTLELSFTSGYSIPTTAKQNEWDSAYTNSHSHTNKTILDGITSTRVSNWNTAYTHSQSEHQSIINGIGFVKANGKTLSYDNSSYSLSSHNHSGVYQPLHTGLTNIATQSASATTGLLRKTAANTWTFDTNTYSLSNHTHTFASLTSKPTTLSGYGITDAAPKSHSDISGESTIHHTHSNKTTIDGITSTGVSNWNTAFTNNHTHANKTVLDGIDSTKVSNWNTAYTNNHTHSNKSNLDTINQAMATTNAVTFASLTALTSVRTNKADFGNTWTLEPSGTEVQLKYGGATKMRFLSDGSIAAMGELTAYASATTGGASDFLSTITGGTVAGKVGLSGTSYPNLYGNGSLLVLGKGNSTTDSIAISAGSLRYYGSSMALGSSTNMWNNTYTDKITLGNGWTIEHSSTALTIKKDGVIKGTFNA